MTLALFDLQVDYINQHGHFMVLSSLTGLKQEELSEFQLNMLSANRIPNLLELQLEAREGQTQLYYHITGKRMLAHWLRMEKLTLHRFYSLLYRIAEVLDDSKIYMLHPGRYVLNEDYIYCGSGLEDLYFTYIPKQHLEGKAAISADLQQLASRWIRMVTELHGSGYQELMSYLLDENFNIPELKLLLLKHISQSTTVVMTAADEGTALPEIDLAEPPARSGGEFQRTVKKDERALVDFLRMESGFTSASETMHAAATLSNSTASDEEKPAREARRKQMLTVLMSVLICCLVWKLYAESPGDTMLYVSLAVTVFVCAVTVMLIKKARIVPNREEQDVPMERFSALAYDVQADGGFLSQIGLEQSDKEAEPVLQHEIDMRTTLLKPADATVFLSRSGTPGMGTVTSPYLELTKNGVKEKLNLNNNSFVIGRAGEGVDWVQEEAGVSRLHAEIVKEDKSFAIKDLGSRNGTAVNGELLTPYRAHPLKEGDIVTIVSAEYTFKVGS